MADGLGRISGTEGYGVDRVRVGQRQHGCVSLDAKDAINSAARVHHASVCRRALTPQPPSPQGKGEQEVFFDANRNNLTQKW